jgi:hypothetical protein
VTEWYDGAGLDAEYALSHPRNKQHLLNAEMSRLGPLPQRYRTAKWGIKKARNNSKGSKKKEGATAEL